MHSILIVDDSASVRNSLRVILEPWGFEIDQAENGAEALKLLRQFDYELVFLDLNMPVLGGVELLRILRQSNSPVKVVLVTSGTSRDSIAPAVKLGARGYISKPFTGAAVRRSISEVLGIDFAKLAIPRTRLLVAHSDEDVAQLLYGLLPEHVDIDATAAVEPCIELARERRYQLVLVEAQMIVSSAWTGA